MHASSAHSRILANVACITVVLLAASARPARAQTSPGRPTAQTAEEWFDADERELEDRFADGDLDGEDVAALLSPRRIERGIERIERTPSGGSDLLAQSWISLVGFGGELPSGLHEVGGFVVVGLALDKIAQGRTSTTSRPPPLRRMAFAEDASTRSTPAPSTAPSSAPLTRLGHLAIDATLARGAVRTAWRTSGIEVSDARIDEMIKRSRLSVLLPETRLRAMQVFQDGEHTTSYINESGTIIDTSGSTTTVEARLTWRFDRLLYAGDEPSLERVRLEREEARARIGGRVLELLFAWQRALLDEEASDAGSHAELEASLRQCEAEISLDVLTGGWFSAQPVVRTRRPRP